jgi:hypothetical protein
VVEQKPKKKYKVEQKKCKVVEQKEKKAVDGRAKKCKAVEQKLLKKYIYQLAEAENSRRWCNAAPGKLKRAQGGT